MTAPLRRYWTLRRRPAGRTGARCWDAAAALLLACAPCAALAADDGGAVGPAETTDMLPARRVELPWDSRPALRHAPARTTVEIDTRGQPALNPPAANALPTRGSAAAAWNDPGRLGVHVVRWAPAGPGGARFGVSLGFSGALQSPAAPTLNTVASAAQPLRPELGVRWRSGWSGQHRVDVAAWRSDPGANPDDPAADHSATYNARVELQFHDAKRALGFDLPQGALGLQLQGGGHLMLRARHGGPMLYYRRQW